MKWVLLPLQRYADFSGRSRRLEYWSFQLLFTALFMLWGVFLVGAFIHEIESPGTGAGFLSILVPGLLAIILTAVPALAVQVRRFHDIGYSGWMVLINFVPYIGPLIVMVFMFLRGEAGSNQYGPNPKLAV